MVFTSAIAALLVLGIGLAVYDVQPRLGSTSSSLTTSSISSITSSSDFLPSAFTLSVKLSNYSIVQGEASNERVTENLTNLSTDIQMFQGAENLIPQYSMFYSANHSLACTFYDADYNNANFSIAPNESLYFNGTLPTYSYSSGRQACSGIQDAVSGTYLLEVFSAWGYGSGTNIIPISSSNVTITIMPPPSNTTQSSTTSSG